MAATTPVGLWITSGVPDALFGVEGVQRVGESAGNGWRRLESARSVRRIGAPISAVMVPAMAGRRFSIAGVTPVSRSRRSASVIIGSAVRAAAAAASTSSAFPAGTLPMGLFGGWVDHLDHADALGAAQAPSR